jgi:tetratricopeptide (TPR) repeat protein
VDPDGRGFVPLADALRRAEDYREARRVLEEGLDRHPEFSSGHLVSAWLHLDQGKTEEAETSFGFVLDLDPRNVSALSGLGDLLEARGDLVGALGHFRNLLQENPGDGELRDRIRGLETQLEEDRGGPEPGKDEVEATLPELGSPGAFARFADELDWEKATIQDDRPYLGPKVEAGKPVEEVDDQPVWLAEDGVPIPEVRDRQDALVTPTLGEIYFRQGLLDRAEEVFEVLLERDPGNQHLAARLDAVRAVRRGELQGPDSAFPEERREPDPPPVGTSEADGVEAVPVATLEPDESEVVPVEALGPSESEVLAIESLAPDASRIVDIQELAPPASEVVPVEILTLVATEPVFQRQPDPEGVVPIQSLAPGELDVVSIEALAPDLPDEKEGGPGDDPRLHAFQDWLDKLP